MFNDMMAGVKEDVVGYVYNLEVQVEKAKPVVPAAVSNLLRGAATRAAAVGRASSEAASAGTDDEKAAESADASPVEPAGSEDVEADASETTSEDADAAATDDADGDEDPRAEQLEAESRVVLRAKGLDDGPNERQLRYSSAEGSDVQDAGTLTRAQRRRRARTGDAPTSSTVSDKPEGAPQGDGMNRAQRRAGRRRKG